MTGLLEAVDTLNEARCLFAAAHMAVESIGKTGLGADVEAKALDAVLYVAWHKIETGIDMVDQVRLGAKACANEDRPRTSPDLACMARPAPCARLPTAPRSVARPSREGRMMEITSSRKTGRPKGYIANYQPQAKTRALLDAVDMVLSEYREHWPLTVRQVFYRLVGAYGFPKDESFYAKLIDHIGRARRGRMITFDAIRDDGVVTHVMDHFDDQDDFLRHVRELGQNYRRNLLANQDLHVEVWCEAAGMLSQLFKVSREFSVQAYSSGGFDSLTAKKDLADRICAIGKPTVILHLGDFDPSGKSMFDVIAEDVSAFVTADRPWSTVTVEFKRIALTADQVFKHKLATVPPKKTDSRTARWEGETCQLEALSPDHIAHILRSNIVDLFEYHQLQDDLAAQAVERQQIAYALPAPGGAK